MKKTILVPTDFSDNATAAVHYGIGMAQKYDFEIHLVHTYTPLTTRFGDDTFNSEMIANAKEQAGTKMEHLHQQIVAAHPDLSITYDCLEGDLSEVLTAISGKASHQLIVMGTKGASGLKDKLLGTNTYQTILKAPLPVLAIPADYGNFRLERAGLLSNFKNSDILLLEDFTAIFGRSIDITLLHVRETSSPQEEAELISWKNHLQEKTGLPKIHWKIDTVINRLDVKENITQCIHDMAEEAESHALLVMYNNRSFFRRVFSRNLVKSIVHQINRPVFFFKER